MSLCPQLRSRSSVMSADHIICVAVKPRPAAAAWMQVGYRTSHPAASQSGSPPRCSAGTSPDDCKHKQVAAVVTVIGCIAADKYEQLRPQLRSHGTVITLDHIV